MSFEDKVQRKKSTRWVRASTANYDGDDWIEEEYYEDEDEPTQQVPELPPIPSEHLTKYQESTKSSNQQNNTSNNDHNEHNDDNDANSFDETINSPEINQLKFQNINLDEDDAPKEEEEEEEEEDDPINDTVDEYANIIRDDDSEEEDFRPQSSSRFQPLPRSPEVERFGTSKDHQEEKQQSVEPVEPLIDDDGKNLERNEAQSSSFQPFPEEENHISKVDHKEEQEEEYEPSSITHQEPHPEPTSAALNSSRDSIVTPLSGTEEKPDSDFQPFPEADDEDEDNNNNGTDNRPLSIQESEEGEELNKNQPVVVEPKTIEHYAEKDTDVDHHQEYVNRDFIPPVEDSEDEDEYVPTSNRFKSSVLEDQQPVVSKEVEESESLVEGENNDEGDLSVEEIGSTTIQPLQEEDEETSEIIDEEPRRIEIPPIPETISSSYEETETPHIEPHNNNSFLEVPHGDDAGDISDTDTLHIHDPDEPGSPSIEEIRRELSNTSLHDIPKDDSYFKEHAYLGSLINTPEPDDENEVKFQKQNEQGGKKSDESDSHPRTLSQYYSSVNDYFDDYADTSDNETNLKVNRDSRASLHSSGSLSTGSFSIKSESRYRYSKASDRDSSFNQSGSDVHSLNPIMADSASTTDSVKDQAITSTASREGNLNPAMSINFGHWRPDTDSFRDQFISGTAPPLPTLDNYARNSMGEIIEDRGSFIEKENRELDTNDVKLKDEESHKIKNDEHDKSIDSLGNTLSTSDTDNYSHLSVEPKNAGESYKTESNSVLPLHIPLSTPDLKEQNQGQYFHEKLTNTETNLRNSDSSEGLKDVTKDSKLNITKISGNKRTNYSMKQISSISDPTKRIESLRNARTEEASLNLGLNEWLSFAKDSAGAETYKSNVHNSHVAQAYADASSTMSRKHTLTNNVGSFLHKRRVFQDTSSHAQSLAKGIFTRGKKMLKNDN